MNTIQVNCIGNCYFIDTLTSVDFQKFVRKTGKVVKTYEGVVYRENFKTYPFRKVIEKLFTWRQKNKGEGNDVMQLLVKLKMNALNGEQFRKNTEEKLACKSEC